MSDIKKLAEFGNPYFKKSFGEEKKIVRDYGMKKIPIGLKKNGDIYYLNLNDAIRMIILGLPGSGKTFFYRGIVDRMKKAGYAIFFCPDVKDEFKTSARPVQKKFRKMLLEHEEPEGMKIVTLRPTFFKQLRENKPPEGNVWFSPDMKEISKADFGTLLRSEKMSPPQQVMVDMIYEELGKYMKSGEDIDISYVEKIIQELKSDLIQPTTRTSMLMKLKPLGKSHFIEKEHSKSLVHAIQNGFSVSINLENFDHFSKGSFAYPTVIMSIAFRTIIGARREKKIKPLVIVLDELSAFITKRVENSFRSEIEFSIRNDRRYNVSLLMATQDLGIVPDQIIKLSRYFGIPHSADFDTFKEALMAAGKIRNHQTAIQTVNYWKKQMQKHDWLIIDKENGTTDIVRPLAPLSEHMESQ